MSEFDYMLLFGLSFTLLTASHKDCGLPGIMYRQSWILYFEPASFYMTPCSYIDKWSTSDGPTDDLSNQESSNIETDRCSKRNTIKTGKNL